MKKWIRIPGLALGVALAVFCLGRYSPLGGIGDEAGFICRKAGSLVLRLWYGHSFGDLRLGRFYREYLVNKANLVMLGDSITSMGDWNALTGRRDIANRGISGDTTEGMLARMEGIYFLHPKLCFFMGGVNDVLRGRAGDTVQNIRAIVLGLKDHGVTPVLQSILYTAGPGEINRQIDGLNAILEEFAVENGIEFIDLNRVMARDQKLIGEYTIDGLHLSAEGYAVWRDAILPVIRKCDSSNDHK